MKSVLHVRPSSQILWSNRALLSFYSRGADRLRFHISVLTPNTEVFQETRIAHLLSVCPAAVYATFPNESHKHFPEPLSPDLCQDWQDSPITYCPKQTVHNAQLRAGSALWFLDHHTRKYSVLRYLGENTMGSPDPDHYDPRNAKTTPSRKVYTFHFHYNQNRPEYLFHITRPIVPTPGPHS